MNLIEAVKSGKRFTKKGKTKIFSGLILNIGGSVSLKCINGEPCQTTVEDVLAEDWEIAEASVTIDSTRFESLFNEAVLETAEIKNSFLQTYESGSAAEVFKHMKKRLFGG
jgi:hypothetical protein